MSSIDKATVLKARMAKYTPYRLNTLIYKLSGGRLMNKTPGGDLKILLLTTTGRKSGKPRTHPVMYYQDAEDFVITASNSGADKPPLWYLNLRANPQAINTGWEFDTASCGARSQWGRAHSFMERHGGETTRLQRV